jgi:hypothetical protein
MSEFSETLDALRRARATRDDAREQLQRARLRQLTLQRLQNKAERREILEDGGENQHRSFIRIVRGIEARACTNREQQGLIRQRNADVAQLIGNLFQRTPQQLIEEWDDSLPIMLLPLRVETRFKDAELWVRVFPDEIAINTHEKLLTEREQTFGMAYWKALRAAATDDARKAAWQDLVKRFGANRAAWVALQTKPTNWSDPPPGSDDALHPEV